MRMGFGDAVGRQWVRSMAMLDFISSIRHESRMFHDLITDCDFNVAVPSCPDWTLADLAWHLTEVQNFWGEISENLLVDPGEVQELSRPGNAGLAEAFATASRRLVVALSSHDPDARCWSWDENGQNVGWVRRRQAHEALIHRVDAELAAEARSEIDSELAGDGVAEILEVMLDSSSLPAWATFEPDGTTASLTVLDTGMGWWMRFGRFIGVEPEGGRTHDLPSIQLEGSGGAADAAISGSGADLDLWLWGRGSADDLIVSGDLSLADKLRATAADSTT